jgi:ComF family protein
MLCGACLRKAPAWDRALAALAYEYPVDRIVRKFKFQRNLACGQLLADELIRCFEQSGSAAPDILIPVPLHFTRRFWRGFNQAEFLARQLGSRLRIPVLVHKLLRKKRTSAQSGLGRRERQRNIRGAFQCRTTGKLRVALVDDVMTTGTTLAACARAVRAAGASHVSVWVAARVDSNWQSLR